MKKIEQILQEKNVNVEALPQKIQSAIDNSKKHYADWEQNKLSLNDESSAEEIAENEELRESVEEFNQSISNVIDNIIADELEEKNLTEKILPNIASNSDVVIKQKDTKKGIGIGAFFLGAAVLIITAGAVNMMNKK